MSGAILASSADNTVPALLSLVGRRATGKSSVAEQLRRFGFPVYSSDACLQRLCSNGGEGVSILRDLYPELIDDEQVNEAKILTKIALDGHIIAENIHAALAPWLTADLQLALRSARGHWLLVTDDPTSHSCAARLEGGDTHSMHLVDVTCNSAVQQQRLDLCHPDWSKEVLDAMVSIVPEASNEAPRLVVDTSHAALAPMRAQVAQIVEDLTQKNPRAWSNWIHGCVRQSTPQRQIRLITFDLDDTLYPVMPPLLHAAQHLNALVQQKLPRSAAHHGDVGLRMREDMKHKLRSEPLLGHDLTEIRRQVLLEWAEAHGDDVAVVDHVMEEFIAVRSQVGKHLFADVLPTLSALRSAGYRLGAITNGNADLRNNCQELSDYFDFVVSAGDAGAAKPRLAPFLMACALGEVSPSEVLHVGDNLEADVYGALKCGIRAAFLNREASTSIQVEDIIQEHGNMSDEVEMTLPFVKYHIFFLSGHVHIPWLALLDPFYASSGKKA
ncbi:hypothetical protein CYMTET_25321 [Cymbomonas tetramitiformis]|uniref:Uncharacterized protein n=1 Tax=Cymbomonas tetramitiformis TaxID=36881 RepID=A0AAE0FTY7_9CHLO|nr:hypothetical protein CYMTET_25321 [Cymbomonas tetramitiformis]